MKSIYAIREEGNCALLFKKKEDAKKVIKNPDENYGMSIISAVCDIKQYIGFKIPKGKIVEISFKMTR